MRAGDCAGRGYGGAGGEWTLAHWKGRSCRLLADFSIAYGEPEYRNALCAQIGETVATAKLEELDSLTVEFESGTVLALSLREEDMDGPEAGSYSEDGSGVGDEEF